MMRTRMNEWRKLEGKGDKPVEERGMLRSKERGKVERMEINSECRV